MEHHLEVIYSTVNELKLPAPAIVEAKASANSFNLYLRILLFGAILGLRKRKFIPLMTTRVYNRKEKGRGRGSARKNRDKI